MPWQCNDCATSIPDDTAACPNCRAAKASWTMVAEQTRAFVISGRKVLLKRGEGGAPTPATAAPDPTQALVDADVVYALSYARARAMADAGQRPPSRSVLLARLFPKQGRDWTVGLEVLFETREVLERTFPREADPDFDPAGHVDAVALLFVYGPRPEGAEDPTFAGIEVVDVSEETPLGFAPKVSLAALKKPAREVRLAAEPSFYLAARFLDASGLVPVAARAFRVGGREGATDEHGVAVLDGMPLEPLRVAFAEGEVLAPPMPGPGLLCNVSVPWIASSAEERAAHRREERWSYEDDAPAAAPLPDWFPWDAEDAEQAGEHDDDDAPRSHHGHAHAEEEDDEAHETGSLLARLYDAVGERPLAGRSYTIRAADGRDALFEGTLDRQGALRVDDVPAGDYVLQVQGARQTTPLLVLEPGDEPQVRYLA